MKRFQKYKIIKLVHNKNTMIVANINSCGLNYAFELKDFLLF